MATSGSFTTSSYEGRSLTFSWNRTSTNIANNTSTIAWSVTGSGSYTAGWVTCGDIDVVINGTTVYNSSAENRINVWSGTVVASGTTTITHGADGSKSFSASVNAAIYNYAQNCSGSGTWALDSIPRASNIDKIANTSGTSISALNTGNDIRVYFTPKSTAFKYRITVSMNGSSAQNNSAGVTVSATSQQYYQVNIPHTWLSNKEADTLTCKLETLNGTTVIGTNTKTITMSVPSSIIPTLGTPSSTPVNTNTTISGWAIYVAGYSKARIVCTASGNSGSTISRFQITGDATTTINGTSLSYDVNLSSSGVKTFTISAIDSRGRATAAKSISINVQSYVAPSVQPLTVIRSDASGNASASGTNAKLSFIGYYSNIGSNAATATFAYKLSTATAYTNISNTSTGSGGTINGSIVLSTITFAAASEYDFKITVTDSLGNAVSRTARLSSVSRTLNVAKYGNGVAIGKMSTITTSGAAGKLECAWDADFDKNVNIDGNTVIGGSTTLGSIVNIKSGIDMGGLLGQTKELAIRFSNPATSTNPHNTYIYGGNPNSVNAIGCYDGINKRGVMGYSDVDNKISFGDANTDIYFGSSNIYFGGSKLADYIVEQGTSGIWTYRKWNSGVAECWGVYTMSSAATKSWGSLYYSDTLAPRINYPFTFTSRPQESVFLHGSSIAGWAYPEAGGIGQNTTTQTGQYGFVRPTSISSAEVKYEYTVVGKWK